MLNQSDVQQPSQALKKGIEQPFSKTDTFTNGSSKKSHNESTAAAIDIRIKNNTQGEADYLVVHSPTSH